MGIARFRQLTRNRRETSNWNRTGGVCSIELMPHLFPTSRRTRTQHRLSPIPPRPSDLLRHRHPHRSQSLQYHPPLHPLPVSTPVSFSDVVTLATPGRGVLKGCMESAERVYRGMVRRGGRSNWGGAGEGSVSVGLDVEKGGKIEGCGERCLFPCFFWAHVMLRYTKPDEVESAL